MSVKGFITCNIPLCCDLVPAQAANIMLNDKGEAKLADFGVAARYSSTYSK